MSASVEVASVMSLPSPVAGLGTFDCSVAPGVCFMRVTSMTEPLDTVDTPLVFVSDTEPAAPVNVRPAFTG